MKATISKWTAISAIAVAFIGLISSVVDLYGSAEAVESKGIAMEDEIVKTITNLHTTIENMETRINELEKFAHPLEMDSIKPAKKHRGKNRGYKRQWTQQREAP